MLKKSYVLVPDDERVAVLTRSSVFSRVSRLWFPTTIANGLAAAPNWRVVVKMSTFRRTRTTMIVALASASVSALALMSKEAADKEMPDT